MPRRTVSSNAFHPLNGWTAPDDIGIDLGITLLSAENLRTASVWRLFMKNECTTKALRLTREEKVEIAENEKVATAT